MPDYTCKIDPFKGIKRSDCETALRTCNFPLVPFVPRNSLLRNDSIEYLKFKLKDDPNSASSEEFSQEVPIIGVAIDEDVFKWVRARQMFFQHKHLCNPVERFTTAKILLKGEAKLLWEIKEHQAIHQIAEIG